MHHLILSSSKDEVGTVVRSSWFDGLTMRTLLAILFALCLFAQSAPLHAEEPPVEILVGPITVYPLANWVLLSTHSYENTILDPPPATFDGIEGVSTDGIDWMLIVLTYANGGTEYETNIEAPLANAAQQLGSAMPEDAAVAFDGIAFDKLYGSFTANAGKSITRPLIMVGLIKKAGYGSVLVSASVAKTDAKSRNRNYSIVALFERQGEPFLIRIALGTSRPLRETDLDLLDAVMHVLTKGASD